LISIIMADSLPSIPLAPEILSRTPPEVIELLLRLLVRIEELEAKLNQNSSNSNKPPSSDSPFTPKLEAPKKPKKPRKRKGHRQQCLRPTELTELHPAHCSCGCREVDEQEPYYIHQVIELPEIKATVRHIFLYRGWCRACGKTVKAHIPHELRTGFGPRFCALVAELAAVHGNSRRAVQDFLFSVIGTPVSQGAVQNILDRVSRAVAPHYEAIGEAVRCAPVNHVDETTWKRNKALEWLWLMCNSTAAFFMLHRNRSQAAFHALIQDWQGILVSDGYVVYQQWAYGRQSCLAHLIREAKGLSERHNPALSRPGAWAMKELRLLCRMAKTRPSVGQWNMFYARLIRLIGLYREQPDEAGRFVRRLQREIDSLWLFLQEQGVCPTNNHAERTLRFAVLWRKRSFGTRVEKGNSFVERLLSLRQTCRLQGKRTFPILVDAMQAFLLGNRPNLHWIQAFACDTP
jgi:transposase